MDVKKYFMHQKMMTNVLYALLPIILMAVYFYGWRVIVMLAVSILAAVLAEYGVMRLVQKEKTKVTEACLVSAVLFVLTLPPATPLYIVVIGIVFGIIFGKSVFGGFGRNIFNPALVGRAFVYIAFPYHLALAWTQPFLELPGGFAKYQATADMISQATPLIAMKSGEAAALDLKSLLFGMHAGSIGETARLLILLGAFFLIYTKTASWQIMLATMAGAAVAEGVFQVAGVISEPFYVYLMNGGLLFAAVFMATDPVSAPKNNWAKWVCGALIGIFAMVIRTFSLFAEGVMFAVLIVNALTPLIERQLSQLQAKQKAKAQVAKAPAAAAATPASPAAPAAPAQKED